MPKSIQDIMNMSDEDMAQTNVFDDSIPETKVDDVVEQEPPVVEEEAKQEDLPTGSSEAEDDDDKDEKDDGVAEPLGGAEKQPDAAKPVAGEKPDAKSEKPKTEEKPEDKSAKPESAAKVEAVPATKVVEPDYKAAYEQIMKPFKANGKEIKLENIDEAITLMQKGANYVKKMQAIQPNLKILRMLESNGILDEDKLNRFIDMTKGNKEAFAQFAKESGIDPLDIDTEKAVEYKAGNHRVSDAEIGLQSILEDVSSTDYGQELVIEMNHSWDDASKREVFKEPELIQVLANQKKSGIYDQIAGEVERFKVLGHPQISKLSFIRAYQLVGKALSEKGLLKGQQPAPANADTAQVQNSQTPELGRGTAPAKKAVTNDEQAKAASPSAKSSKKAVEKFNPLAVSDEEFLKQMNIRV